MSIHIEYLVCVCVCVCVCAFVCVHSDHAALTLFFMKKIILHAAHTPRRDVHQGLRPRAGAVPLPLNCLTLLPRTPVLTERDRQAEIDRQVYTINMVLLIWYYTHTHTHTHEYTRMHTYTRMTYIYSANKRLFTQTCIDTCLCDESFVCICMCAGVYACCNIKKKEIHVNTHTSVLHTKGSLSQTHIRHELIVIASGIAYGYTCVFIVLSAYCYLCPHNAACVLILLQTNHLALSSIIQIKLLQIELINPFTPLSPGS